MGVVELELSDPELLRDPFGGYGRVREEAPVMRLMAPGFGGMWAVTRHADARAMLSDPRFAPAAASYLRPVVPEHCRRYMTTMQEMDGAGHQRMRRLVTPAFSARRTTEFRPRITPLVDRLLDELAARAEDGVVDLFAHFAAPLPMDVICELAGVPAADRERWRGYGAAILSGVGATFAQIIPDVIADSLTAVAEARDDALISYLVGIHEGQGDRLSEDELVTLVWHLVLAGQTPANLIANAVATLLTEPGLADRLRAEPALMPTAVEELTRWSGPQLLTVPRFAAEDTDLCGVTIPKGEPVTAVIAAANRDPRAFTDPDRIDLGRRDNAHLGYAHGPHFCLGAPLARAQVEIALAALLRRFPRLAVAADPETLRAPDPGTWRVTALPVTL